MGYWGKLEEKIKAQELRKQGLSYKEIITEVAVSKATLSEWCRDIELTLKQKERLMENKKFGQQKGSIIAAENKRRIRLEKTKRIFKEAKKEIGLLSGRDDFIAGIALYAGEGNKTEGRAGFANSDPKIIKFMMNWFIRVCKIPMSKFRGSIWLHEELNEMVAKEFWSNLTGIPKEQFHKTYIAEIKKDSKKVRKNIHQYGVFSILFNDTDTQRRIL